MSFATSKPITRIAIIGVGQVGGAAAYALTLSSIAREILLVDVDVGLRDSQVRDLSDAAYSNRRNTRVRAATYQEAGQCEIVVITAGSKYPKGKTTHGKDSRTMVIPVYMYFLQGDSAHITSWRSRGDEHPTHVPQYCDCPQCNRRNDALQIRYHLVACGKPR